MKMRGGVVALGPVLLFGAPARPQEMTFDGYIEFEARKQDSPGRQEGTLGTHHLICRGTP
ncbi:MAG: hypothetical protein ACE5IQ_05140 [Candidatus Methylomirabilales bacterium]